MVIFGKLADAEITANNAKKNKYNFLIILLFKILCNEKTDLRLDFKGKEFADLLTLQSTIKEQNIYRSKSIIHGRKNKCTRKGVLYVTKTDSKLCTKDGIKAVL